MFCLYCQEITSQNNVDDFISVSGILITHNLVNVTKTYVQQPDHNVVIKVYVKEDFYLYNGKASTTIDKRHVYNEDVPFALDYKKDGAVVQSLPTNTKVGPVMRFYLDYDAETINKTVGSYWEFWAYIESWKSDKSSIEDKNPGEIFDTAIVQTLTNGGIFSTYLNTTLEDPEDHKFKTTVMTEFPEANTINTNLICPVYPMYNTATAKTTVVGFRKYLNFWTNNANESNTNWMLSASNNHGFMVYTPNEGHQISIDPSVKFKLENSYAGYYYATFLVKVDANGYVTFNRCKPNESPSETPQKYVCGFESKLYFIEVGPWETYPAHVGTTLSEYNEDDLIPPDDYSILEDTCYTTCNRDDNYQQYISVISYDDAQKEIVTDSGTLGPYTGDRCKYRYSGPRNKGIFYHYTTTITGNHSTGYTPKYKNTIKWDNAYSSELFDKPFWEMSATEILNDSQRA